MILRQVLILPPLLCYGFFNVLPELSQIPSSLLKNSITEFTKKKDAENLSHMVPIRSILAAKYGISHLTKLISLVFQQAGTVFETIWFR